MTGLATRSNVSRSSWFCDRSSSLNLRSTTEMITPVIDEADHKTDKHAYLSFTRDLQGAYSTSVPPENYIRALAMV